MRKEKLVSISEAEWQVMEVVWAASGRIASEAILEKLSETKDWSEGTVRSLLARLGKKQALVSTREGRRYLYEAGRQKEECLKEESHAFMGRFFGGKLEPMMAHFLGDEKVGAGELDRLEALIEQKRKELEK